MIDLRQDYITTRVVRVNNKNIDIINKIYDKITKEAIEAYHTHGFKKEDLYIVKSADIRYVGQEHTVKTMVPSGELKDDEDLQVVRGNFEKLHKQYYEFILPDSAIEFVNFNITAFCKIEKSEIKPLKIKGKPEDAVEERRVVDFDEDGKIEVPVYVRAKLGVGNEIKGPAIIEEKTAVTALYPSQKLYVDEYGNLIIEEV